ncbi:hypothetical protein C0J52_23159 [Blattella germanica]|nr:hypothetical protein C0J52_23159 [Blattella germanica]
MKHLFLSNHLLHSFVVYTLAKIETQSFGVNRQSSIDFNMRPSGGLTNIQAIFHLIPCRLQHIWCNRCQGVPYAVFQVLNIVN